MRADTSRENWPLLMNSSMSVETHCKTPVSSFQPVVNGPVKLPYERFIDIDSKLVGIKVHQIEQSSATCGKVLIKLRTIKDKKLRTLSEKRISFCF